MRCLCLSPTLPWPLHGGRQINAHHLLRELVARGHEAHLAVLRPVEPALLSAWPLAGRVPVTMLSPTLASAAEAQPESAACRRWNGYFGTRAWVAAAVADTARIVAPDYVEACGLEVLPWLARLPRSLPKLWLAADEALLFHLSQLCSRQGARAKLRTLIEGMRLAQYERAFAGAIDAAVAVSPADAAWLRRVAGFRHVGVCPNGVDPDFFAPSSEQIEPETLIFWGRLDFAPNVAAVAWFTRRVWPVLRRRRPGLRWWLVGRDPSPELRRAIADEAGIELVGAVDDVRPWACRAAVTVLPMRGGAGIKNKLLEAAAMARPIVASPRAVAGLEWQGEPPLRVARRVGDWVRQVDALLDAPAAAYGLGAAARAWVTKHHNWADGVIWRERFLADRISGRAGDIAPQRLPGRESAA